MTAGGHCTQAQDPLVEAMCSLITMDSFQEVKFFYLKLLGKIHPDNELKATIFCVVTLDRGTLSELHHLHK